MLFIRQAERGDIENIAELEKECFPIPWSEDSIRNDVLYSSIAYVVVAEFDDAFAGYADVWFVAGEGQINNVAVVPHYRHKGVGTALLEALIDYVRDLGGTEMSLEVRPSNIAAMRLYRRLGFEEVGERGGYYLDDGEAAAIMKLFFEENQDDADEYEADESSNY